MRKTVLVSKGKNVQEAIAIGLELLQAHAQDVDIEILELESKGFLGMFGSKPAKVRLTKKERSIESEMSSLTSPPLSGSEEVESRTTTLTNKRDKMKNQKEMGKAWVKDGKIFCKETPAHYPTITPKKGISLYKNGELVTRKTVITEKDQLKIELIHERKDTEWSIEIDESKMVAFLLVKPGFKRMRTLLDQEPSHHIKLEYSEAEEVTNHLQVTHVTQRMKELGINTRVEKIEIIKACETLESGVFEIARGIEPQKGRDGWIELKVNTEHLKNGPKVLENDMVDFREIQTIPNVDAGQVIAVVHPPVSGKSGITITGETIPPPPSQELVIQVKRGADLIDHGRKIVSLDAGKPHIEYRGKVAKISIMPRLYHASDVDLASGNLRFLGDIEVQGAVEEGMCVEALGDVLIHGMSNRSTITAGNRIVIQKSVINSYLTAGKSNIMLAEIGQLLGKIAYELQGLSLAINDIYLSPAFKTSDIAKMGLSSLIRILLERKFKTLPPEVKKLAEMTAKADQEQMLDIEYKEVATELVNAFLKFLPSQLRSQEDLSTLIQQVKSLYEFSLTPPEPDASITLTYALNCEIYCSGDVSIVDQGCINTKIHCGGKIHVSGMIRGGEVYAALGADIGEAGSPGGKSTKIRVPKGQTIKIKYVMEGTHLQIGDKVYQFLRAENDVFARIDKEGKILLH